MSNITEKLNDIKMKYLGQFYLISTYDKDGLVPMKSIAEYLDKMEIEISGLIYMELNKDCDCDCDICASCISRPLLKDIVEEEN